MRNYQRSHFVAVRNFNARIDRNRTWLRVKDQRKTHHPEQHQQGGANQAVPGTPAHDFYGFAAHCPCNLGRLALCSLLPGPANLEKCHEWVEN